MDAMKTTKYLTCEDASEHKPLMAPETVMGRY